MGRGKEGSLKSIHSPIPINCFVLYMCAGCLGSNPQATGFDPRLSHTRTFPPLPAPWAAHLVLAQCWAVLGAGWQWPGPLQCPVLLDQGSQTAGLGRGVDLSEQGGEFVHHSTALVEGEVLDGGGRV